MAIRSDKFEMLAVFMMAYFSSLFTLLLMLPQVSVLSLLTVKAPRGCLARLC